MKNNNTIRQHYVWRDYLRNFCFKEDSIYSLINKTKIVPNNLMNVAQERYFYKLHDVGKEEYSFLNSFLHYYISENNELKEYLHAVLISYTSSFLKETIKDSKVKDSFEKEIQNDFFERHMTENENLGKKLIAANTILELKKCFDSENKFKTILFLSMQLVRTKKQKNKILKEFENHKIDFQKIWFYISFSIGNILAYNLIRIRKLKVSYIRNESNCEFITSDQPIINLETELSEKGSSKYFKLYLPLSPTRAIILDFDSPNDYFDEIIITEDIYVKNLNYMIANESDMFIFSKRKENLADLI